MELTLVVLAAGKASRYGRLKQLEPVGPYGAALIDYTIHDALQAGFGRIVLVIAPGLALEFREHIEHVFAGRVNVDLVVQDIGAVPDGFSVPAGRQKPWGTAHAVIAAAPGLSEPCCVVNADDFYGRSSYRVLRDQLQDEPETAALVGFELRSTLSAHGGVSRGICEDDDDGFLTRLIEVRHVEERDGQVVGTEVSGRPITLRGDEAASMNMWGLTPRMLDALQHQFEDFLEHDGSDPDAEFLLSTAMGQQVSTGVARLRVLTSSEHWFGMTFAADTPTVIARIAELVAIGEYPERLWKGLP